MHAVHLFFVWEAGTPAGLNLDDVCGRDQADGLSCGTQATENLSFLRGRFSPCGKDSEMSDLVESVFGNL